MTQCIVKYLSSNMMKFGERKMSYKLKKIVIINNVFLTRQYALDVKLKNRRKFI